MIQTHGNITNQMDVIYHYPENVFENVKYRTRWVDREMTRIHRYNQKDINSQNCGTYRALYMLLVSE